MAFIINKASGLLNTALLKEKLNEYEDNHYQEFYDHCLVLLDDDAPHPEISNPRGIYEASDALLQQIIEKFETNFKNLSAFEMMGILEYVENIKLKNKIQNNRVSSVMDNFLGLKLIQAIVDKKLNKEVEVSCEEVKKALNDKDQNFRDEKEYKKFVSHKNKIMNTFQFIYPTNQVKFEASEPNYVLGSSLMSKVIAKKPNIINRVSRYLKINIAKILNILNEITGAKFNRNNSKSLVKEYELENSVYRNHVKRTIKTNLNNNITKKLKGVVKSRSSTHLQEELGKLNLIDPKKLGDNFKEALRFGDKKLAELYPGKEGVQRVSSEELANKFNNK
ncbi:MAG: hypothetical protein JWM09_1232 [Francisellaceae bacterium]|nr:hypothetical protein [Francisellaceae bacterium]